VSCCAGAAGPVDEVAAEPHAVSVAAAQSRRRLVAGRRRRSASRTEFGITVLVSAGSARVCSDPSDVLPERHAGARGVAFAGAAGDAAKEARA